VAHWPEELESLREEARSMAVMVADGYSQVMAGLDHRERMAKGREIIPVEDAPDGVDTTIAGIPCRVFDPAGDGRRGTYLHIHGGAMMWGSPRMNDLANNELSKRHAVRVVSVDYRLAPEHPFPAGSDDCIRVAERVLADEPGPIVIGGESAGGYFAALTLLRIRDELDAIERITGANLVFGVFDLSGTPTSRGVRPTDLVDVLEDDLRDIVREAYLPGRSAEDARDPAISPHWPPVKTTHQ